MVSDGMSRSPVAAGVATHRIAPAAGRDRPAHAS